MMRTPETLSGSTAPAHRTPSDPRDVSRTARRSSEDPTLLRIRWEVSAEAVGRARPDLIEPGAKSDASVVLDCTIGRRATVTLQSSDGRVLTTLHADVPVLRAIDASRDQEHVEVPGVLNATMRRSSPRVLYASTTVLRDLGIGGGRYDAPLASA